MSTRKEILKRWIEILRYKASVYEHSLRAAGKDVVSPSLDDICNEIQAFSAGLGCEEERKN